MNIFLILLLWKLTQATILWASKEKFVYSLTDAKVDYGIYSSYRKDYFLPYDIYPEVFLCRFITQ